VFAFLLGSVSRIFTTLQEVDDPIILGGFVAGFALNAVLALQMLYYWNAAPAKGKARSKGAPSYAAVAAGDSKPSAESTGAQKVKSPSTRRRG
jgi:mannose-P-dolichol utilization defect protein 1